MIIIKGRKLCTVTVDMPVMKMTKFHLIVFIITSYVGVNVDGAWAVVAAFNTGLFKLGECR